MSSVFRCQSCGEIHEGFAALTFPAPLPWAWATEAEQASDWKIDSDFCRKLDSEHYIRAVLVLPIIDSDLTLEFGIWSTLAPDNFYRYIETFDSEEQASLGPMFGWFANALPGYPDTMALKCKVHTQNNRKRPLIEFEPTEHPLAVHQRRGIPFDEATRYYHTHIVRN